MMARAEFKVVDVAGLPVYEIGREERLDGNSFVKWNTARWLSSRTFKMMSWEMQGMARALFDMCQAETPVGTLPDDDAELAIMLRIDESRMRELRKLEFGPLRNWVRCTSHGEIRLMHPVVLEVIRDALERRALAQLSKEEKAVAMRLERLRKAVMQEGWPKDVVADDVLIRRMDDWLMERRISKRTVEVYRSAMFHAVQERWIGAEVMRGV